VRARRALKAAKMWINKALGRGWNSWTDSVNDLKRIHLILYRAITRMQRRLLSSAWTTWLDYAMKMKSLNAGETLLHVVSLEMNVLGDSPMDVLAYRTMCASAFQVIIGYENGT
jgi:hypothetical protein